MPAELHHAGIRRVVANVLMAVNDPLRKAECLLAAQTDRLGRQLFDAVTEEQD